MTRAPDTKPHVVGNEQFTGLLAECILGWKACPDRFIKSGRTWIRRNGFRPLSRLEDAFFLLRHATGDYKLTSVDGRFTAKVRIGTRTGRATGEPEAKTICLAIGQALGIEAPQ
jgi:hypothetical protein